MVCSIDGNYFNNGDSKQIAATLERSERGYRVVSAEGVLNFCGLSELKASNRLGNTPRKLRFPDGGLMIVRQNDLIDQWFDNRRKSRFFTRLNAIESRWTWALAAIAIIPLIFYGFFNILIPAAAKPISRLIPEEFALQLDAMTLRELDNYLGESTTSQMEQLKISAAFDLVTSAVPDLDMELYFRNGGEWVGANAFALPGGSIIVTDEVLDAGLTTREITAVFAHEAGHVYHQHSMQQLVRISGLGATLTLLFNDLSFISQSLLVGGGTILQASAYSRDAEREADEFGHQILDKLGLPPSCFSSALGKLTAYYQPLPQHESGDEASGQPEQHENREEPAEGIVTTGLLQWLSTHPSNEERMAAFAGSCA